MCGIAGILAFNENGKNYLPKINLAVSSLHKRGPDNNDIYLHNNVALGHTRLSVIDTSDMASQPFTDETGRYTIIYNGEVYNFPELKEQLIKKGVKFLTHCDTEVLLYLYIQEGPSFLNRLNGFFAFAIYDKVEESLFIARDRSGIKPLLIYQDNDKLMFASEMKALISLGIPKEIDAVSLYSYLQLNYIPGTASIFKNVRKLVPGYYMYIKENKITEKQYYKIPFESGNYQNISYASAKEKLFQLLNESVKKRLISDVPLGAFLSGGIDSSIIVALASQHTRQLNTFSIGFKDEPLFDETYYAELVAKKYNTNHTVFRLTNDDLFSVLHNVLEYTDEPFADSSALAVYILSKYTRKHVKVALSGDGADEMFAGYNKHMAEYKARNGGILNNLIKWSSPVWNILPQSRNTRFTNKIRQFSRFAKGVGLSPQERYWRWCSFADENEVSKLLSSGFDKNTYLQRKSGLIKYIKDDRGINDVLYSDMYLVLQNDMLVKVDMMSMANSLEVRVPFLDYELVNFVFSLPSEYKIDDKRRKIILKDTFREHLPEEIHNRGKQGFEVPLLKWFRTELRSMITDDLLENNFIENQNIFNLKEINNLKTTLFSDNPGDIHARIWGLLVFQHWWKKYAVN